MIRGSVSQPSIGFFVGVCTEQKCEDANSASSAFVQMLQSLVYLFKSQRLNNQRLFTMVFGKL